jgi:site-specific recombinase XerD
MEITRYLRKDQVRSDGLVQVNMRVCWDGQKVKFAIKGALVKESDWDETARKVRGKVKFASDINSRLDDHEFAIRQAFYAMERDGPNLTPDLVRTEIKQIQLRLSGKDLEKPKKAAPVKLPAFWEQFMADHKGLKSDSYVRHFRAVITHLVAFNPSIDFKDITLSFANRFVQYLMDQGLSDDSTYGALKKIRAVMKYARKCKIDVPFDYEDFPSRTFHIEREFLSNEELLQLEQTVIMNDYLMRQRDVFLFACYTGLRWSDLPQATPGRLSLIGNEAVLRIIQTKTGKANPIPLSGHAQRILKKYPTGLPLVAQPRYNRALKEICKLAGLTRTITVSRYYRGKRVDVDKQLWQIVSSHTARHTFATLSLKRGMGITDVQGMLGHGYIGSTMIYSHSLVQDKVDAMRKAWGDELPEN